MPIADAQMTWWLNITVLAVACAIDLRTRRIPNWLTVPFLVAGLGCQWMINGTTGISQGLAGATLAVAIFGMPCFLRAMGMGDFKVAAGVAEWIGPGQFFQLR